VKLENSLFSIIHTLGPANCPAKMSKSAGKYFRKTTCPCPSLFRELKGEGSRRSGGLGRRTMGKAVGGGEGGGVGGRVSR
jgi:hypothetical protein